MFWNMDFHINDYEVRTSTHELLYKGCSQKVEPLVYQLLIFMLENPSRVLSRSELVRKVWRSRVISDSALSATICAARKAIGDTGKAQACIKTVSGSGYRFVAKFTCTEESINAVSRNNAVGFNNVESPNNAEGSNNVVHHDFQQKKLEQEPYSLNLPDKPSIAVMNFVNMGSSGKGVLLAYGLTAEVNSALARLPHLFVIARASSASLAQQELLPNEISKRLGVRYLVYGNIKNTVKRVRLTLSIVDAVHNSEIWSEHYDRTLDDVPQLQDEIIQSIVTTIDSSVEQAEIERAFLVPTEDLSAWEYYHRGLCYINSTKAEDVDKAQQYFQKSTQLDSRFARAHASLSYIYTNRQLLNVAESSDNDNFNKAFEYAQLSIELCKNDSMGYMSLGRVSYFLKKYEQALLCIEQGIFLSPNLTHCHFLKGMIAESTCDYVNAHQYLDRAERLSPYDPLQFAIKMVRAISFAHQKDYTKAVETSIQATQYPKAFFTTYAIAAACHQLAGDSKQAKLYANKVLLLKPNYSVEIYQRLIPHKDESTRSDFINAMLDTGIPQVSHSS